MQPAPIKPIITIDTLQQIDIRVGTIVRVEDIEKSNSLVRLTVDCGDRERSVMAGMKGERDDPQEIVGRQALFVLNLEPKKMFGELSEGMLFDLGYEDGIPPALAMPENPVPNGTRAG